MSQPAIWQPEAFPGSSNGGGYQDWSGESGGEAGTAVHHNGVMRGCGEGEGKSCGEKQQKSFHSPMHTEGEEWQAAILFHEAITQRRTKQAKLYMSSPC